MTEARPLDVGSRSPDAFKIGVVAPLSRPGWVEAGRNLVAGVELCAEEANAAGGVGGRPLELVIRDTAADPTRASAAMDEFAETGVVAAVGGYHSVAARAAAERADALRLPFVCTSAVLDELTRGRTDWVARLAPVQSRGWAIYADHLLSEGRARVAAAMGSGAYWAAGAKVLRERLAGGGGSLPLLDAGALSPARVAAEVADRGFGALLLLTGHPEPAVSIVRAARREPRLADLLIGAPAGQPEFADWASLLGGLGWGVPFLRYRHRDLGPTGERILPGLRARLGHDPSFVALEGYDGMMALRALLGGCGENRTRIARSWGVASVQGSRGTIRFSRTPETGVWQWTWPPIEVVDRDPGRPDRLRVLRRSDDEDAVGVRP